MALDVDATTVAVVTGAASGIGRGLAEALAARGATLVLTDVRQDALEQTAADLRTTGAMVHSAVVDVSDGTAMHDLAAHTQEQFGAVHLLCNNAGFVCPPSPSWQQDADVWRRMIDVKVGGTINGVAAFVPHMVRQERGHILNTASSGGLAPLPGRSPYSTVMHAVVGLTETLDLEMKAENDGLGATVLCPGLVDTPIGANSAELGLLPDHPDLHASIRDLAPSVLSPREVAEAALDAIARGLVHVAPGDGVTERARARVDALLDDLDARFSRP